MKPSDDIAAAAAARALVARYLDPRGRWALADDDEARALREHPAARRAWAQAIATHRALVGAPTGLPSGVEQRRQAAMAIARSGAAPVVHRWWFGWRRALLPLALAGTALVLVSVQSPSAEPEEWLRARGISGFELPEPTVGLGVGGVTEAGQEYEAISSHAVHLDDWLRFSYTNERAELRWLYVFALQVDGAGLALHPIAPLPDEARSLPIRAGRFVPLLFETRLAARHREGPVRLVALFTAAPLGVDAVASTVDQLDPSSVEALPSTVQDRLREQLALGPTDVVQILDTRIVPGSASPSGTRQETP